MWSTHFLPPPTRRYGLTRFGFGFGASPLEDEAEVEGPAFEAEEAALSVKPGSGARTGIGNELEPAIGPASVGGTNEGRGNVTVAGDINDCRSELGAFTDGGANVDTGWDGSTTVEVVDG